MLPAISPPTSSRPTFLIHTAQPCWPPSWDTVFCPAQSFHPHGRSLCLEPHSSCSLLSWLLLILQVSAQTSLLRESFLSYQTRRSAPSPFPPFTSVTPPCLFPHCLYCSPTLFIYLFTCVYGFHLRKMQAPWSLRTCQPLAFTIFSLVPWTIITRQTVGVQRMNWLLEWTEWMNDWMNE